MIEKDVPRSLLEMVQKFAEKQGKFANLYAYELDNGDDILGIQFGSHLGNSHEMVVHINITKEKSSGFVIEDAEITQEFITEVKKLSEKLMRMFTLTEIFGGR